MVDSDGGAVTLRVLHEQQTRMEEQLQRQGEQQDRLQEQLAQVLAAVKAAQGPPGGQPPPMFIPGFIGTPHSGSLMSPQDQSPAFQPKGHTRHCASGAGRRASLTAEEREQQRHLAALKFEQRTPQLRGISPRPPLHSGPPSVDRPLSARASRPSSARASRTSRTSDTMAAAAAAAASAAKEKTSAEGSPTKRRPQVGFGENEDTDPLAGNTMSPTGAVSTEAKSKLWARARTASKMLQAAELEQLNRRDSGPDSEPRSPTANAEAGLRDILTDDNAVVNAGHRVRRILDFLVLACILTELLGSSYLIAIRKEVPTAVYSMIVGLFTPVFILWIFMNFRTAILRGWTLHESKSEIREIYIRGKPANEESRFLGWCAYDIFVCFPWDLVLGWGTNYFAFRCGLFIRLGKSLLVLRLLQLSSPLEQRELFDRVVKNIFWLVVLGHFMACGWIFVASWSEQGFEDDVNVELQRRDQYIAALYWATATVSSVGYGDISANQNSETRILSVFVMPMGTLICMWAGAKITEWMVVTDPFELSKDEKKRKLTALMENNDIPWSLQRQALAVYPVITETSSKEYNSILDELPKNLQEQIRVQIKLRLIRQVPILEGLAHECQLSLADVTVPEEYLMDMVISAEGEPGKAMFLIEHGMIEQFVFDPSTRRELQMQTMMGGSFFGEKALVDRSSLCECTTRTVTACFMYALPKESFDIVAEVYPQLRERVSAAVRARGERQRSMIADVLKNLRGAEDMEDMPEALSDGMEEMSQRENAD